jgi:hypothetical protein
VVVQQTQLDTLLILAARTVRSIAFKPRRKILLIIMDSTDLEEAPNTRHLESVSMVNMVNMVNMVIKVMAQK